MGCAEMMVVSGGRSEGDEQHRQDVEGTICGVADVGDLGEEQQNGDTDEGGPYSGYYGGSISGLCYTTGHW